MVCVPPKSVRTSGAALLIASGSLILLCTGVHLYVSLLHPVTQTTHPMLDALELRSARCSASPAVLACPVGGIAQQVQPAGEVDPRSRGPGVEPQVLGLVGG